MHLFTSQLLTINYKINIIGKYRFSVVLADPKNDRNDLTFCPEQSFESDKLARDYAALLALWHFQKTLPLENKLPEPYSTSWRSLLEKEKEEKMNPKTKLKKEESSTTTVATASSTSSAIIPTTTPVVAPVERIIKIIVQEGKSSDTVPDWLCDGCGTQNFGTLQSGALRTKCFKCQRIKSETCSTVLPVTMLTMPTANIVTKSSSSSSSSSSQNVQNNAVTMKDSSTIQNKNITIKSAPSAVLDLKLDKHFAVSKGDASKRRLEEIAIKKRRKA